MTCDEVSRRDVAEEYLLGRLSETERDAFEVHYFACEAASTRSGASARFGWR